MYVLVSIETLFVDAGVGRWRFVVPSRKSTVESEQSLGCKAVRLGRINTGFLGRGIVDNAVVGDSWLHT